MLQTTNDLPRPKVSPLMASWLLTFTLLSCTLLALTFIWLAVFSLSPWAVTVAVAQNFPDFTLSSDQPRYREAQVKNILNRSGPGETSPSAPETPVKPQTQPKSAPDTPTQPQALSKNVPDKSRPPTSVDTVADLHGCWVNENYQPTLNREQHLYYCFNESGLAQAYTSIYDFDGRLTNECHFAANVKMNENGFTMVEGPVCSGWVPWVFDCQLTRPGEVSCIYTDPANDQFHVDLTFQGADVPKPKHLK